ncbi:hypothetical protein HDU98_001316 [Podochytrium sp. JEL0797]|nr:hypothetical protein HDU98_001316 [Podochytrium sp. JEL0797]
MSSPHSPHAPFDLLETLPPSQVAAWLRDAGVDREAAAAFERHDIAGNCLRFLTHPLLHEMGITKVATQKRLLILIANATTPHPSHASLSAHDRLNRIPRFSSNQTTTTTTTTTIQQNQIPSHSSKFSSLDRFRAPGKSLSPNIAPRSSSKTVAIESQQIPQKHSRYPSNTMPTDLFPPSSDSPTAPHPRVPLPLSATMEYPGAANSSGGGSSATNSPQQLKLSSSLSDLNIGGVWRRPGGGGGVSGGGGNSGSVLMAGAIQHPMPFSASLSGLTGGSSKQASVIIKVQDGNQEIHKFDVSNLLADAQAIRKLVFRKFHIAEDQQRGYALFYSAGAPRDMSGATTSTITDDDLVRLVTNASQSGSSFHQQLEFILRKTFSYQKRDEPSNMLFAPPPPTTTTTAPAPSLQQQQAATAAAALAKSLRVFGLLGGDSSLSAVQQLSSPPTPSTPTSSNVFSTASVPSSYFDAPPRPKKSPNEAIAAQPQNGSQGYAMNAQQQYLMQQQMMEQKQRQAVNGLKTRRASKRSSSSGAPTTALGRTPPSVMSESSSTTRRTSRRAPSSSAQGNGTTTKGMVPHNASSLSTSSSSAPRFATTTHPTSSMLMEPNLRRGSKFKSFFSERPRDETIADKLQKYFPQLNEEEEDSTIALVAPLPPPPPPQQQSSVGTTTTSAGASSAVIRPRLESKLTRTATTTTIGSTSTVPPSPLSGGRFVTSTGVEIPQRSRSIRNKVEQAVRESRRKSVMSGLVVRRRLSVAASALMLLREGEGEEGGEEEEVGRGGGGGGVAPSLVAVAVGVQPQQRNSGGIQQRRGVSVIRIGTGVNPSLGGNAPATVVEEGGGDVSAGVVGEGGVGVGVEEDLLMGEIGGGDVETMPREEEEAVVPVKKPLAPIVNWTQGKMIGQGAFGKVFHALNLDTGDIMAVKQVLLGPTGVSAAPGGRMPNAAAEANKKKQADALERELEVLQQLDHENIVRYLGFELKDGSLNVFLQYVSGGSIASLLNKTGRLEDVVARYFTFQILCGMAYLHSKNIIHRDIKGGNILVDADGICKITDFGTSKKNAYEMAYQRVTRMSMQGTIPWMAPEVAKGKGYSAKVDIWSVGCMVLEMLTGFPPWHKVSASIIYLLGTGNSPPIAEDLPQLAKDFLSLCFIIDPEKRPTALELVDHEFCRLSKEESEAFDFQEWVLAAEARHAEEVGEEEMEEESSEYTDSDEESSSEEEEEEEVLSAASDGDVASDA